MGGGEITLYVLRFSATRTTFYKQGNEHGAADN
jgi:hypothetical protein